MEPVAVGDSLRVGVSHAIFHQSHVNAVADALQTSRHQLPANSPAWMPDAIIFVIVFLVVYIAVAWFGANLSKTIQGVDGIGPSSTDTG